MVENHSLGVRQAEFFQPHPHAAAYQTADIRQQVPKGQVLRFLFETGHIS
jgi:hypothetical protein